MSGGSRMEKKDKQTTLDMFDNEKPCSAPFADMMLKEVAELKLAIKVLAEAIMWQEEKDVPMYPELRDKLELLAK